MADTENPTRKCPYCKEEIHRDALRCKHCHADIAPGFGSALGTQKAVPHGTRLADAVGGGETLDLRVFGVERLKADTGQCPPLDSDDVGIWVFVAENETDCFYELVVEWHPSPYGVFRDVRFVGPS